MKNGNHKQSFKNAISGIVLSFRNERNLKLMGIISVLVFVVALVLKVSLIEFTMIVWAIFAVVTVEMINTSLEAITDLVKEEWHQKAKMAKDVASGMVLLGVVGSVIVGGLIFMPKLIKLMVNF
ncbi:MAG TPA: diacylglycerol kinase family protein [Candidatus Bathyarchaeia archaeon]|nr:diacylglycerol kinase family protein [Candidatus Bathyarchaeia archaeon]